MYEVCLLATTPRLSEWFFRSYPSLRRIGFFRCAYHVVPRQSVTHLPESEFGLRCIQSSSVCSSHLN